MIKNKPTLGYIGIGLMGQPMTLRLLAAGYTVVVWGRNPAKLSRVVEQGAIVAESAAAVAKAADIIFLCLSDTKAVEAVCFAEADTSLIVGLDKGKTVIDCSSIQPDATRLIAERIKTETGADWLDAPVSGGVIGAEQGNLAIMVGGDVDAVERVRSVVMHLCQRFTHMGASGAGQTTKVISDKKYTLWLVCLPPCCVATAVA